LAVFVLCLAVFVDFYFGWYGERGYIEDVEIMFFNTIHARYIFKLILSEVSSLFFDKNRNNLN